MQTMVICVVPDGTKLLFISVLGATDVSSLWDGACDDGRGSKETVCREIQWPFSVVHLSNNDDGGRVNRCSVSPSKGLAIASAKAGVLYSRVGIGPLEGLR